MQYYPNLFSPFKIKDFTFRNRIFSTPNQTRFKNDLEISYFEAKAKGGAAQVTLGETPISSKYLRQSRAFVPVLDDPNDLPQLAETALAIKLHGAAASIQMQHPGLFGIKHTKDAPDPMGPMGFIRHDGAEVKAMDEEMIEEVVESFANAAATVQRAGFDMCQVHGAHGWLLAQFLSSRTNKRTDNYGGSLENRARFPIAVVDRIREKCGPGFLIEYRISGDELVEGGMRIEEVIEFLKMLENKIDLVHVSAGVHEAHETIHRMFPHTSFTENGCNVYLAEAVKKAVNIPVITVGGICDPVLAERILAEGKADIIGMGRALLADPNLPNKARNGRRHEIIPCLRCNGCLTGVVFNDNLACAVNPQTARELRWQRVPMPSASRKVLVIGGGPAGMKAAITAVERGHDVTLLEKSDSLGGLLRVADYDSMKSDMKAFKDYLIRRTLSLVKVRLNTEAAPELVEKLAPDVVIAAVGSSPIFPNIPGIGGETVISALEAYYDAAKVGEQVVVIGGGLVGCETGMHLAELGKTVTIVEMLDTIGEASNPRHTRLLIEKLDATPAVDYRTGTRCLEVTPTGIKVAGKDGAEEFIKADTVVCAAGMRSNSNTVEQLRNCVPDFFPIGDCVKPQKILQAMQGGYFTALDI